MEPGSFSRTANPRFYLDSDPGCTDHPPMKSIIPRYYMAPMADITTPALRKTLRRLCASTVLSTEMISAGGLLSGAVYNDHVAKKLCTDDPIIYQLAGNDPGIMSEAAAELQKLGPYSIDINMGCPAPDIVKKGWGAKLLTTTDLAVEIVRRCRSVLTDCRLSVKMRSGYFDNNIPALLSLTKNFELEGVDFITLHPRWARLYFSRTADWSLVETLNRELRIPVIGNGDIRTASDAQDKIKKNICSGVMIGRAALTQPWIFTLCESEPGTELTVNCEEVFTEILNNIRDMLPRELHASRSHRYSYYFTQGLAYGHNLFSLIRRETDINAMTEVIIEYFERNSHERVRICTA